MELAASKNQPQMIDVMLKPRVCHKEMGVVGCALGRAISENHPKVVKKIIRNVGPLGLSMLGDSALYQAGRMGRVEVVQILLDSGVSARFEKDCDCHGQCSCGFLNFQFGDAARHGQTAVANYKEIYDLEELVNSMFWPALTSNHLETAKMLADYGFELPPEVPEACNYTGNVEHLDYFVKEHSVDPLLKDCLKRPVKERLLEMVRYLVDCGADLNCNFSNRHEDSALTLARRKEHLDMVKLLLKKGADVNQPNGKNLTPFMVATELESVELIELLLLEGATISEKFTIQKSYYDMQEYIVNQNMKDLFSKFDCST